MLRFKIFVISFLRKQIFNRHRRIAAAIIADAIITVAIITVQL